MDGVADCPPSVFLGRSNLRWSGSGHAAAVRLTTVAVQASAAPRIRNPPATAIRILWPLALTPVRGRRNLPHHPASVPLAAMCVFRPDAFGFGFGFGFGLGLHAFGFALGVGLRVGPVPTFPRAPIAGHDAVDNRVDPDVGARWRAKGA
jgi:hypothetical protein